MSSYFVLTTIDNRETKLISYLEKKDIDFKIEQLLLGDIQIKNITNSDTNKIIDYVIKSKN